jgi:hypothetical protein
MRFSENGGASMVSPAANMEGQWASVPASGPQGERRYIVNWQNGQWITTLQVSSGLRHFDGQNQFGLKFSAERISPISKTESAAELEPSVPRLEKEKRSATAPLQKSGDEAVANPFATREQTAASEATIPQSANVAVPPDDPDSGLGNIQVTFTDGHSEILTKGGKCNLPHVSASGDVGWNRPDKLTNDRYGRNADILHLRLRDGSAKEFKPNVLFIVEWGFANNNSEVVIKSMAHHGPSSFIKYEIKTGRVTGEVQGYHPSEELPDWARPLAD